MNELKQWVRQLFSDSDFSHTRVTIVSDAAPQRNGVGAYYHDLGRYLELAVEDLTVIAPEIQANGKWKGGLAITMPGDPTQKFMIPNPWRIWKQMKQQRPDVVLIATPGVYGVFGALFGRILGARVLIGFHTWFEKLTDLYWGKIQGSVNLYYFKISNALLFRFGHTVYANSDHMVEIARLQGAKDCQLVGTPLCFEYANQPLTEPSGQLKRLLFAGRLAAEKNLETIIQAAKDHPDMEFNIIGDGPQRQMIEAAAKELNNLNYLGWHSRDELMEVIDQHDGLLLTSTVESFGTIALESMARNRFTIVSDDCGIVEWQSLQNGLSIYSNKDGLSNHLDNLKSYTSEQILAISQAGHAGALELNHWSLSLWQKLFVKANHELEESHQP